MDRVTATAPIAPAHAVGQQNKRQQQRKRDEDKPTPQADGRPDDGTPADGDKGRVLDDYA